MNTNHSATITNLTTSATQAGWTVTSTDFHINLLRGEDTINIQLHNGGCFHYAHSNLYNNFGDSRRLNTIKAVLQEVAA